MVGGEDEKIAAAREKARLAKNKEQAAAKKAVIAKIVALAPYKPGRLRNYPLEKLEALLGVPAWLLIRKAPRIFWRLDTKTSRMERLEEFELAMQMGLDVTERQVREEGNIDPPAPGEKVLKGPGRDAATRAAAQQRRKRGRGASTDKKAA